MLKVPPSVVRFSIVVGGLAALLFGVVAFRGGADRAPSTPVQDRAGKAGLEPTVSPPNLAALAARVASGGTMLPTLEQTEEEAKVEDEQVGLASDWLTSEAFEQRIAGAEQLGAYPNRAAERALVRALQADAEARVRAAAAASLARVEQPEEQTIDALLAALVDRDEETRLAAWSAVQSYLSHAKLNRAKRKALVRDLRQLTKSGHLPRALKAEVVGYLNDQR